MSWTDRDFIKFLSGRDSTVEYADRKDDLKLTSSCPVKSRQLLILLYPDTRTPVLSSNENPDCRGSF